MKHERLDELQSADAGVAQVKHSSKNPLKMKNATKSGRNYEEPSAMMTKCAEPYLGDRQVEGKNGETIAEGECVGNEVGTARGQRTKGVVETSWADGLEEENEEENEEATKSNRNLSSGDDDDSPPDNDTKTAAHLVGCRRWPSHITRKPPILHQSLISGKY
ncbi:unnamed protein product [Nippostrongylus brasiliensis]|uniref:Uncharacterized protein n=1 Tax=Nippostrongylus brasiliensis TaxID=27835 RepID=A0A0N4YJA0_NIPBR|nr:unnamed protein product [Nippostrongylus brasiliensis]